MLMKLTRPRLGQLELIWAMAFATCHVTHRMWESFAADWRSGGAADLVMEKLDVLRWRTPERSDENGELRIFFVANEYGQLRLIVETRLVNTCFQGVPKTALPSAAASAALEIEDGQSLYGAGGDIRNYFYIVEVMSDMFSLPRCRAGMVERAGCRLSQRLHFNDHLIPCLKVLPFGPSLSTAGHEDFAQDRMPGRSCRARATECCHLSGQLLRLRRRPRAGELWPGTANA